MSKGAYSVVSYPDSSNIDEVLLRLRAAGASCMWIMHDKDVDEDGKEKKHHWHIACGWETGFPNWKKFIELKKTIDAECYTGESKKLSVFAKMIPEKCLVHDAELLEQYFLHTDPKSVAEGKHRYNDDELFKDDDWLGAVYNSAEFRREKRSRFKKAEKASDFAAIVSFIKSNHIDEWCILVDRLAAESPDLLKACVSNAYSIKAYLDSYRSSGSAIDDATKPLRERIADLEKTIAGYESGDRVKLKQYEDIARKWHARYMESCKERDKVDWMLHNAVMILLDYAKSSGDNPTYTDVLDALERSPFDDYMEMIDGCEAIEDFLK